MPQVRKSRVVTACLTVDVPISTGPHPVRKEHSRDSYNQESSLESWLDAAGGAEQEALPRGYSSAPCSLPLVLHGRAPTSCPVSFSLNIRLQVSQGSLESWLNAAGGAQQESLPLYCCLQLVVVVVGQGHQAGRGHGAGAAGVAVQDVASGRGEGLTGPGQGHVVEALQGEVKTRQEAVNKGVWSQCNRGSHVAMQEANFLSTRCRHNRHGCGG